MRARARVDAFAAKVLDPAPAAAAILDAFAVTPAPPSPPLVAVRRLAVPLVLRARAPVARCGSVRRARRPRGPSPARRPRPSPDTEPPPAAQPAGGGGADGAEKKKSDGEGAGRGAGAEDVTEVTEAGFEALVGRSDEVSLPA